MSVFDGELKVNGIEGLRIADSSTMPWDSTGKTWRRALSQRAIGLSFHGKALPRDDGRTRCIYWLV